MFESQFNIQNLIKRLSNYDKIDFSENNSEMDLLTKKYDGDNNSIFDADELQAIKNDFEAFAMQDGNGEELNEEEAKGFIESLLGNFSNLTNESDTLLGVITHELGHYLDLYKSNYSKFANDPELQKIYEEEFEAFQAASTTSQQEYIWYFTNPEWQGQAAERVAETHSIMYSEETPMLNIRRLYLAEYFPRTIAKIMELLLEEEGVI